MKPDPFIGRERRQASAERSSSAGHSCVPSWMLNATLLHLHLILTSQPALHPQLCTILTPEKQMVQVLPERCIKRNKRIVYSAVFERCGLFLADSGRLWNGEVLQPLASENRVTPLENVPPSFLASGSADLFMWSTRPAGNVYSCSIWSIKALRLEEKRGKGTVRKAERGTDGGVEGTAGGGLC